MSQVLVIHKKSFFPRREEGQIEKGTTSGLCAIMIEENREA